MNIKQLKNLFSRPLLPRELGAYKVKSSPIFWAKKADDLKFSADILWPHAEEQMMKIDEIVKSKDISRLRDLKNVFPIYLSLIGFSFEVLLKGIIIKNNSTLVSNGRMDKQLATHDLLELAILARLQLTQNERIFCEQAFDAMIKDGRYPISIKAEVPKYSMAVGGHCKDVFEELYIKLRPQLNILTDKNNNSMEVDF